jgi:hypothetical protein
MLGFIPMNRTATIYTASTYDNWGQMTYNKSQTLKCQLLFNEVNQTIMDKNGVEVVFECTTVFHGKVDISMEDRIEISSPVGEIKQLPVIAIYYLEDYRGNIVSTGVRLGTGRRM